jgi:hypothetical protein
MTRRRSTRPALALLAAAVLVSPSCISSEVEPRETERDGYAVASPVLQREIDQRVENLPYLHGKDYLASVARLIYIGEPAIPSLIEALEADHVQSRGAAAYILGEIGDKRSIPEIRPLLEDSSEMVRLEAAGSLATLGDWSCFPTLITALRHEKPVVRLKSFQVLSKQVKQDFGYVYNAPDDERERAVRRWEEWWKTAQSESLL